MTARLSRRALLEYARDGLVTEIGIGSGSLLEEELAELTAYLAQIDEELGKYARLNNPSPRDAKLLSLKPHFPGCETPEPSLSSMVYRYYRMYFEQPKADEYAGKYIEAIRAALKQQEQKR